MHERMHVIDGPMLTDDGTVDLDAAIVDQWPVDLRNW